MRNVATTLALALVPALAAAQARIEVGWISLEPRLPSPTRLDAAPGEGWPVEGDRVHWVAHLINRAAAPVPAVAYEWSIDGRGAASGEFDVPPGESTLWLPWSWTFVRHEVALRLFPPTGAGDLSAEDDTLAVISDALSLCLGVEQDVYNWLLEGGRPGFERLIQREVDNWNAILARAVHPATPLGVLDRIRLDTVAVYPDGSFSSVEDLGTDLVWYFPARRRDDETRFLNRRMDPAYENDQTIVLHELLHERGLIDLYAYAISLGGRTDSRVEIRENGRLVAGSALMPDLTPASGTTTLYRSPANGLMGTRYLKGANLTEHSAFGLNLIAGRRTPRWFDSWGNPQSLGNTPQPGSYANLIPERTLLRLLDQDGRPVPGAQVAVHLDHGVLTYQDVYLETPDLVLSTDLDGWVELPGDLLAGLPSTTTQPPKALVAILGVFTPQARGFAFLPIYDLNLLYIQGNRQVAEAQLSVRLQPY